MVGFAALGGLALAGIASGAGFGLGFGGAAMTTAPITSYRQAYSFASGYGQGMIPGQWEQARVERQIDSYYRNYDRMLKVQNKLFDTVLDMKLKQFQDRSSETRYGYRLTY
jgi:hypothetical protein